MNKVDLSKMLHNLKVATIKHSPEILTGIGIAGMITTTVLAVKATPKALSLIQEAEDYGWGLKSEDDGEWECRELTPVETIKVAWKPYVPAAVTGVMATACLIGASSVSLRRNAALATAYQLSTTALSEYKEKVIETIGEKKEKTVREKVAQKKVDEMVVRQPQVIVTGMGDTLFLEPISMRPFKSDLESVRRIVNDLNERMVLGVEEFISLSEFYDEIGLSHTQSSDEVGWNIGKDGQIRIEYLPGITDDGRPCLVLDYHVLPRYDFHKLM